MMKTRYNHITVPVATINKSSNNHVLPLKSLRHTLLFLIVMVMGVVSAWGQTVNTWDGTVPSTANVSAAVCNGIGISGSGTEADPYVISTAQQFAYFASKMNGNTAWWKLAESIVIDLDGESHKWTYGQNGATFKGHFDGNGSTISNMKFETNATGKGWGLFPNIQGSSATNHAEVKNLTLKNCEIATPASGSYAGANIGLLVGKANGNTDIENIKVEGGSITVDVETTGAHNVAAIAGQLATNENNIKNCSVSDVTVTSGTAVKKEYYVGGVTGNAGNRANIVGNTVSNFTVTLNGNTNGNTNGGNIIGGLIGKVAGVNSTASATLPMGNRSIVQHNTVENPTITMNGSVEVANFMVGGMIGWAGGHTNAFNNKVISPTIALNNDINATSYVGGAIGYQDAYSFVDGLIVSDGSISGPTEDKTVKNNVLFFVGGYLGYQVGSNTNPFQANKFKNIAVTGMNINLGHYIPGGAINNHKFSVGGIAGSVNQPNMSKDLTWGGMPENLIFKGGKIYAPWASTSPIVGNFNAGVSAQNSMTIDIVTTVDAIEKAKSNTWYYNDYKLGLSDEFLNSTSVTEYNAAPTKDKFRKNYSKATEKIGDIQYLAIDNSTFLRNNRYQDSERDLKTVLWWTLAANYAATGAAVTNFTANEQPIYPNNAAATAGNATDYPYYWYFFQGVGNAKYASNTDAENIVKGIEANFTNDVMPVVAMADETNLNVTITNDGETRRGFDDRTLTVTVKQGSTDVTSDYTYQWYLDGKANGTGTTKTLTPHWKDGQGITVNVINDGTILATVSYGFAPGVLHTKTSAENASAELVRSDYNARGTSTNPYIIDCESALRQLSYLSTVHTNMFWETLGKPASPYPTNQSQGHYNRAYYELSADINLGGREFTPISHVGYGGDGSWGTYNTNWPFQGVFDGQAHKISNFRITWSASQYNGNNTNLYYGLFGCVGNAAAARKWGDAENGNTVIKNLIIDGATLTHNTSEKSFYYDQSISTNANNCMVGVLAGMVTSNTTIQNIEIRGSKITDAGSQDYSLATKGLYAGGAIGSLQSAYNKTDAALVSITTQHVAAQVDITLTHPTFANATKNDQLNQFHIGGIIGRYISTGATKEQSQLVMPAYTIYSGSVNAPRAWISPVLGSLRYKDNNNNGWGYYSRIWEGNNLTEASQITVTNALFYNFYIGTTKITDKVPSNSCTYKHRTLTAHADGTESALIYSAQKYQGVNYGTSYVDVEGASLAKLNVAPFDGYNWLWSEGFVHMTTDLVAEADISRTDNTFTASLTRGTPSAYRWEASFDGETWDTIPGASGSVYEAYPSLKLKSIVAFVSDGTKDYRTPVVEVAPDATIIDPQLSKEGDTYSFDLHSTAPDGQLSCTYEWYYTKEDANSKTISPEATNTSFTADPSRVEAGGGLVWCKISVTELGVELYKDLLLIGATVVYVDGTNGNDNVGDSRERGWTDTTPVKTIDHANSLLKSKAQGGNVDNNIIVIMGTLNPHATIKKANYTNPFQSNGKNPATITGYYGKNYNGEIIICQYWGPANGDTENKVNTFETQKGHNCYVLADTKFENLLFRGGSEEKNNFIELHGNDVTFGKGLVMTGFPTLGQDHGNLNSEVIPEFTIVLNATNISENVIRGYTNRTKPQVVTFQSGHYGRIMGGRYTNGFFADAGNTSHTILGSAKNPVWAVVNVEIDPNNQKTNADGTVTYSRDINAIIAGLTDGTMYGDYTINLRGGDVSYIVGGNQGNPVPNGDAAAFTNEGGTISKQWGQWPNASFFGRTIINVQQDPECRNINVGNLYAGGLGRQANGTSATSIVDMYYYGHTEVNVTSGTVGNIYGGGAGGVMGVNPWDAHLPYATTAEYNKSNAIINGVQYGDTRHGIWSSKTASDPMAKVTIHDLNNDGEYVEKSQDLADSYTTINISGGEVNGNVYGGGYGFVTGMPAAVTMQGVGSVFGTTNINITGGNITGHVYGGSQGDKTYYNTKNKYGQTITHIAEMNGTVNINISGTEDKYPTIGGNIYGGGEGIEYEAARTALAQDVTDGRATTQGETIPAQEYDRIATAGNTDLGDAYKTRTNILIDLPESQIFTGNIYGGGALGRVDGATNVVIKGGTFIGNIFGGGKGEDGHQDKAKVTGNTNVIMDDNYGDSKSQHLQAVFGNIYGGGEISKVVGDTKVHIRSGEVEGDIFGAGQGKAQTPNAAAVTGKAEVIVGEKPNP